MFVRNANESGIALKRLNGTSPSMSSPETILCELDDKASRRCENKCCAFIVFVFDVCVVIFLAILAFFLRYTQIFPVFRRDFNCEDASIAHQFDPWPGKVVVFKDYNEAAFLLIVVLLPSILIVVCQIDTTICTPIDSIWKKFKFLVSKTIKISLGFLFGILTTSIISDAIKLCVGRLRPHFLDLCRKPCSFNTSSAYENTTDFQFINGSEASHNDLHLCFDNSTSNIRWASIVIREARMSFPESDLAISAFAGVFIIVYLNKRLRHDCFQTFKSCTSAAILLAIILLANSKQLMNRNFIEDLIFSIVLGAVIAIYISFVHLHAFEESTNLVLLPKQSIFPNVQIPRVVYRGIRRNKPEDRILPEIRVTSEGIVNPAFRRDSEDTRLSMRPQNVTNFHN
ncbi:hypothetical protein B4U79_17932 [Dinothrombium tinctorium]|uniref:Phosphatidic acid phosphatase type 2/haloperoxidase domain-containing protein n=1 Tax=Dinothrombium tinctorium TaxID=1965070 RepID=A0A3S3P8T0_9ACAR|nr:hypothetical protein B4U79_17932 [Dinothrombium tinctorium]